MNDEYRNSPDHNEPLVPLHLHPETCTCWKCHTVHMTYNLVEIYAQEEDYACCKRQIDQWILKGETCVKHGKGDMLKDGRCGLCIAEDQEHAA